MLICHKAPTIELTNLEKFIWLIFWESELNMQAFFFYFYMQHYSEHCQQNFHKSALEGMKKKSYESEIKISTKRNDYSFAIKLFSVISRTLVGGAASYLSALWVIGFLKNNQIHGSFLDERYFDVTLLHTINNTRNFSSTAKIYYSSVSN